MTPRGPRIEHPVYVVADLDAAKDVFERLGFQVTAPSHHPFGTTNRLVVFGETFIELLAIRDADLTKRLDPLLGAGFLQRFLANDDGIALVGLATTDVLRDRAVFADKGLRPGPLLEFQRKVDDPSGGAGIHATVSTLHLMHWASPCLSFFVSQQFEASAVWNTAWQGHENTATDIVGLTYCVDDVAGCHEYVCRVFGNERVHWSVDGLHVDLDGQRLAFLPSGALRSDGFRGRAEVARANAVCEIQISVSDVDHAGRLLEINAVAHERTARSVRILPQDAGGVALELVSRN